MTKFIIIFLMFIVSAYGSESNKIENLSIKDKSVFSIEDTVINFIMQIDKVSIDEAVAIFSKTLTMIKCQNLDKDSENIRIALVTAHIFNKWSPEAQDLADRIAQHIDLSLLPPVVAAASVVMGNRAFVIIKAFINRAPESYTQIIKNAGNHPNTILPQGLILSIGFSSPSGGLAIGKYPTALPLAPPIKLYKGKDDGIKNKDKTKKDNTLLDIPIPKSYSGQ